MNPEVRFAKSEYDEVYKGVKIESNTFYLKNTFKAAI